MDNQILNSYTKISNLNVSRETCNEFETLISMIQDKNKEINIISRKMFEKEQIRERHIIDSAQIIDFVDLNCNTTTDLGSGAPEPKSVVVLQFKSTKSIICAESIICLSLICSFSNIFLLIILISLFLS